MNRPKHALAVVVVALALTAPTASAAVAETVVVTSRRIVAVAHDQGRVAWITKKPTDTYEPYRLTIHDLRTRAQVSTVAGYGFTLEVPPLALAGGRALYTNYSCGNNCYWDVYTIALHDRRVRTVAGFGTSPMSPQNGGAGTSAEAAAGDGATLAFAQVNWQYAAPTCDPQMEDCGPGLPSPGQVWRVAGTSRVAVSGATGDFLLAASNGRIAAAPGGLVEIRNATTGGLISSFTPAGTIRALALDGALAAVLVEGPGGGKRIERYEASTGAFVASTAISRAAAAELDLSGNRIVFRTGRQIRLLQHTNGDTRVLVTANKPPIGMSIEGTQVAWVKRVVWAVNRGGHGFVRSLRVP